MHPPLIDALSKFARTTLPVGTRLFHGARSRSPHTDLAGRTLLGSRKWASQSAKYAVSYAFVDEEGYGERHLWVCALAVDVPALQGGQGSLLPFSPWGAEFPWEFPNAFGMYASAIMGVAGPVALLDHPGNGGRFREVLLTCPAAAITVLDIVKLPNDKAASENLAFAKFGC